MGGSTLLPSRAPHIPASLLIGGNGEQGGGHVPKAQGLKCQSGFMTVQHRKRQIGMTDMTEKQTNKQTFRAL